MIRNILAIAGRPGLFKIVKQGKNMLIVSQLATGKCQPAYARDKVSSLGDISIYTVTDDKPLSEVFELIKAKNEGNKVDIKAIGGDSEIREYFAGILPEFDNDRVYTADIKKYFHGIISLSTPELQILPTATKPKKLNRKNHLPINESVTPFYTIRLSSRPR